MSDAPERKDARRFAGWRCVALAFLSQNMAMGLIYGLFGSIVTEMEARLGMTRFQSSLGFSVIVLMLGLGSAVVGSVLSRRKLRLAFGIAFLFQALGLSVLALTHNYPLYLLACALMGCAMAAAGIICPLLLISRWFDERRAFALGIVNLPMVLCIIAPVASALLPVMGLSALLLTLAAAALGTGALIMLLMIENPAEIGQRPLGARHRNDHAGTDAATAAQSGLGFLTNWRFWSLAIPTSVMSAGGSCFFVHVIPYALESGLSLPRASLLATSFGAAGIGGSLAAGWVADRIRAVPTLIIISVGVALFWLTLPLARDYWILLVQCAAYGAFLAGLVAVKGAAVGELFPPAMIGRVAGALFTAQLPIVFTVPALVGEMRARMGDYVATFGLLGILTILAGLLLGWLAYRGGPVQAGGGVRPD